MPIPLAALAGLGFILGGGIHNLDRQFDKDPYNDPSLWDWGSTALSTIPMMGIGKMGAGTIAKLGAGAGALPLLGRIFDGDPYNNNVDPYDLLPMALGFAAPYALGPFAKAGIPPMLSRPPRFGP